MNAFELLRDPRYLKVWKVMRKRSRNYEVQGEHNPSERVRVRHYLIDNLPSKVRQLEPAFTSEELKMRFHQMDVDELTKQCVLTYARIKRRKLKKN